MTYVRLFCRTISAFSAALTIFASVLFAAVPTAAADVGVAVTIAPSAQTVTTTLSATFVVTQATDTVVCTACFGVTIDFGDGTVEDFYDVTHVTSHRYTREGVYTVTARVTTGELIAGLAEVVVTTGVDSNQQANAEALCDQLAFPAGVRKGRRVATRFEPSRSYSNSTSFEVAYEGGICHVILENGTARVVHGPHYRPYGTIE